MNLYLKLKSEDDFIFLNYPIHAYLDENSATPYEKLSHIIHTRGNVCNQDNVMKRDGLFFTKTHRRMRLCKLQSRDYFNMQKMFFRQME